MKNFTIIPKMFAVENREADSAENALVDFATEMDLDMGNYFKAVPSEEAAHITAQDIVKLIGSLKLSADDCIGIYHALRNQDAVLGGKLWTVKDIETTLEDYFGGEEYSLSDDDIDTIADNIDALTFEECTDSEWDAIKAAVRKSGVSIHVSDIKWDLDPEDFESEAEMMAVYENVLPEETDIPIVDLEYGVDIADYLSDKYEYCVESYGRPE